MNRLRWHLIQIAPQVEAQIRPVGLIGPRIRAKVTRGIARLPRSPQARVAKLIHQRICDIYREETELLAELKTLIETHCPQLLDEHGCGTVTAGIIIGHTAGAKRFPTDACFARHAGTALMAPLTRSPQAEGARRVVGTPFGVRTQVFAAVPCRGSASLPARADE